MDQVTVKADIDDVSLELISSVVQTELIQGSVLAKTIMDVSQFAKPGMDSIKFPKAGSFNVQKKVSGEKVSAQKLTFSSDKLNLDQHAVIQALIEDIASIQSNVPVTAEYLRRMASAHAYQLDLDIFDVINTVATANKSNFASGSAPTKEDFTTARKSLRVGNAPMEQLYCIMSPLREKQVMDLDDFSDADRWMSGSEAIKAAGLFPQGTGQAGFIGRAYGVNLLVSNVVPDSAGLIFYSPSHACYGFQKGPNIQEQYKLEYLANLVSMDQLYGMKGLDGGRRAAQIRTP